jgi:hypothetical protein
LKRSRAWIGAARHPQGGQTLVEFGMIVPLMLFIAVAVGDLGRLYVTAIAVESAAREAADYGAFLGSSAWRQGDDWSTNVIEMRRRACTAMSGVAGYDEPAGTIGHEDCGETATDGTFTPYFVFDTGDDVIEPSGVSDCGVVPADESPCTIHVRVNYRFETFLAFPGLPHSIGLSRDSWFAISDLPGS